MAKIKELSPLVEAVLSLDTYLSEINRLGAKIESLDLKSDYDYEQAQRLMARFTECGQGVSTDIVKLSTQLNEARAQAEVAAKSVAAKAEQLQARQDEYAKKMETFRALGEKVRNLTLSLNDLKKPEGEETTDSDRTRIAQRLAGFESELQPLIEEASTLKREAQGAKLKVVEQGADSLSHSLIAVSKSLDAYKNFDRGN